MTENVTDEMVMEAANDLLKIRTFKNLFDRFWKENETVPSFLTPKGKVLLVYIILTKNLKMDDELYQRFKLMKKRLMEDHERYENQERYEVFKLVYEKLKEKPQLLEKETERPKVFVELLDSIRPQKHIIPNNKLANGMMKMTENYDLTYDLEVGGRKKIYSAVSLNYNDDNIQIFEKDKRFTPYDRSVHNAVCSIFEAGNTHFTTDQVYRCMNGLDDKQFVSPQAAGAITKSLDKSRRINVRIDYTNEFKERNKDDIDIQKVEEFVMEDYVLPAKKVTLKAGGKEVSGYQLNNKPILYEYAQITNQVLTVPSKLLNTKDVIKSTQEVIVIREYLIRRIEVMKRNKNQTNKITLEKIYKEIDHSEPNKDKSKAVRNILTKLLEKFKEEKYIKDYTFYKEARAIKGVEIYY
ncbi:hypothetical protein [Metabacillus fastidiosus]|uniref:hypothetical protein n=1 Tax=Metabacillus fastidiosus TaxID=1458 RepID=UPI003D289BC9